MLFTRSELFKSNNRAAHAVRSSGLSPPISDCKSNVFTDILKTKKSTKVKKFAVIVLFRDDGNECFNL